MNSFIWKNKDSYEDFGIIINKLPSIPKAEKNVYEVEVQGRDGDLTIDYNTYKPIIFSISCTLLDFNKIDEVKAWIDGFDDLIFSWQNDRYYKAKMINKIDIAQSLDNFGEFPLVFKAQPFGYSLNSNIITLVGTGTIFNSTNTTSKPIIKVYGTGSIDLSINSSIIHLTNVIDYVTIDSNLMDCYKDTVLKNSDMLGNFPEFQPGQNAISWTGTLSKIEITPNWRWL